MSKMENDEIKAIRLEKHPTKDVEDQHVNGSLTVIWRDWDHIIQNEPKMVYVSSVNPGEVKGPHLHTKRNSHFVCIRGKVVFVARDASGKYHEIISSEDEPVLVQIPKNCPSAHMNVTKDIATVLAITDLAWRPNDNEMLNINFENYDWTKWTKP